MKKIMMKTISMMKMLNMGYDLSNLIDIIIYYITLILTFMCKDKVFFYIINPKFVCLVLILGVKF